MSLLAPLFLLGALAIAVPVIFHLVRNTTRDRTRFSSLMFLRAVPPRLTRRNRFEHLLLLLLRCAALALLAAAFARPFLHNAGTAATPPAGQARRHLILVDTSASMRRSDLWPLALARTETLLRAATPADQFALAIFNRGFRTLFSFEDWAAADPASRVALARERLAQHPPTWAATHLDQALVQAAELVADPGRATPHQDQQVILVSDLQDGSRLSGLQAREWPKGVVLTFDPLPAKPTSNAGLEWLPESGEDARQAEPAVRLRVRNATSSRHEQFRVTWATPERALADSAVEVHVPAGQSRIVALRLPPKGSGADRVQLQGDEEPFDNQVFLPPPEPSRIQVLYLGTDASDANREPLHFLRHAFQETRRQIVQLVVRPPDVPLSAADLEAAALVVIAAPLSATHADTLRIAAGRGKTLLLLLGSPAAANTLARLLDLPTIEVRDDAASGYRTLAEIDFNHRVFTPFADPRYSDFSRIHFWKHRRLDPAALPSARVLARFDDGDPLFVECPIERGRLLILTSGWHPAESQLALSTKFVPLLYSILELSTQGTALGDRLTVGDSITLPEDLRAGAAPIRLQPPQGPQLTLGATDSAFTQTADPGLYQLIHSRGTQSLAVNLDPAESRLTPLMRDDFEQLGLPVRPGAATASTTARPAPLREAELENRQKLWRWLLIATLGILILEACLAGKLTRQRATAGGASA